MPQSISKSALAGTLAAAGLAALQSGAYAAHLDDEPMATVFAHQTLGVDKKQAPLVGAAAFLLAGALWGALYGAMVPRPNIKNGLGFSVLPWLFVMLVNYPVLGKPVFGGGKPKPILVPLLLNALWGAFVGASAGK